MGRLRKGLIGAIVMGVMPVLAHAQTPVTVVSTPPGSDNPAAVGGIPTIDFITLGPIGPGAPLRYGNVITNSEVVQLDGITLIRGDDYLMDYGVGVVYLKIAQRAGQALNVSYRYKPGPSAAGPGTAQVASLASYNYAIRPGSLNFLAGIGLTERGNDGAVMSNNLFGISNSFNLGHGANLSGLYVIGDREREVNYGGLTMDQTSPRGSNTYRAGGSQLIVQNFTDTLFGGSLKANYQDISRNFNGLAALGGVDAATAARLTAERGLTRTGYSLDDAKFGSTYLSSYYHDVKDGEGGIFWRGYSVENGPFALDYASQQVESSFARFNDIAEANRAQLGNEAGLRRENMNGNWATEFGKIAYSADKISDDATRSQINRNEWALNSSKLRFDMGQESVDGAFSRFGNLLLPEQVEYSREAGIKRDWIGLQATLLGKQLPFSYSQMSLENNLSSFRAQDAAIGSKTWSLEHTDRKIGNGFTAVGDMSDPEIDSNVKSISNMYALDIHPSGSDRAEFLTESGIDRKYDGFSTDALKGWKMSASELQLEGLSDKGKVDSFAASSKNILLSYRREDIGSRFDEINNMMDFERLRLGSLQGLDRTDWGVSVLEGKTRLDATNLDGTSLTGKVERSTIAFDDPNKLNVQLGARSVSSGFQDGPGLTDPDAALLQSLAGYNELDGKVHWNIAPGKTLDTFGETQTNPYSNQTSTTRNTILDWSLDKTTAFNYTDLEQHSNNPISVIFDSVVEKMSLTKDFGRYGILKFVDERDAYDGAIQNVNDQHRDYLGYETRLTAATAFKTEQTFTTYENGQKENITANTISTSISKNTGVSLTDTEVSRTGTDEESHRNYGFWYDLGNGVKLSYGYARDILPNGLNNETSQGLTLGKAPAPGQPANSVQAGQVGNLMLGGAAYQNQWDANDRSQTNGNITATTIKPFKLGPIDDAKFTLNLDSGSDYSRTIHENKLVSGQGRYGTYQFGYEYKSEMDPTGNRAIDRTVKLITDASDKKLISAGVSYKDRTMPDNSTIIIRDYNITMRPMKNVSIVNLLQTNPDVANPGALLGSVPMASRSDKWDLNYKKTDNLTMGATYQELIDDDAHSSSQTAGITVKLFEKIGSPVTLFYGLEDADRSDLWRKTQRYSLQYDEKPGPNQLLSFFIGNLSYEHSVPVGGYSNNNTLRVNYQYRF